MGNSPTGGVGAMDVDFIAFATGWRSPVPLEVRADLDMDGDVDLDDLAIIRMNFNQTEFSPFNTDLNFDGIINLLDYRLWTEVASVNPPGESFVPEPAGLLLALVGAIALGGYRRRGAA